MRCAEISSDLRTESASASARSFNWAVWEELK
jgi:hypothetical protein